MNGLRELEPFFNIQGEYAGIHVLLTHKKANVGKAAGRSCGKGWCAVYGMSDFVIGEDKERFPSTVILGYASLKEEEILEGCKRLIQAWI